MGCAGSGSVSPSLAHVVPSAWMMLDGGGWLWDNTPRVPCVPYTLFSGRVFLKLQRRHMDCAAQYPSYTPSSWNYSGDIWAVLARLLYLMLFLLYEWWTLYNIHIKECFSNGIFFLAKLPQKLMNTPGLMSFVESSLHYTYSGDIWAGPARVLSVLLYLVLFLLHKWWTLQIKVFLKWNLDKVSNEYMGSLLRHLLRNFFISMLFLLHEWWDIVD